MDDLLPKLDDADYMRQALRLAELALAADEAPIGAIVVDPAGHIIGHGHNRRELDHDPTAHAEIIALRQAASHIGSWRLIDCAIYVTLEPCPMCAGAIVNARLRRLVYGCADPKAGAVRSLFQICDDPRLNHRLSITPGVLAEPAADLLRRFFKAKRDLGKK
jgi:tRNA(adenine34) deaminase